VEEKIRKLSKLITRIERNPEELEKIGTKNENKLSRIVGFTGSPGSGKSTLISAIIECLRKKDKSVAVLAVDPKSPLSGGTFFGDRIRMQKHYLDEKIFIRSVSGNTKSGISPSIWNMARVLEIFDFDYIFIESVGTGQSEIDLSFFVDILILVLSPGNGDDIQFLKAGILEVADIYAINKSDTPEYEKFFNLLSSQPVLDNRKTLVKVSGISGNGVADLCETIDNLWSVLLKNGDLFEKRKKAVLKQAELFVIEKLEELVNSKDIPEFRTLREAETFLKERLINEWRDDGLEYQKDRSHWNCR